MKKNKFIVLHNVGDKTKWYVKSIKYEDETYPENDWVLHTIATQQRKDALLFTNKEKAEKVAKILSGQVDEFGYSADYYVI